MEKRKLEKLEIETSLLGFGCMRFPVMQNGGIDRPEAAAMLDRAIAGGVNYIDTAYPYHGGESEVFVGEALKKHDRSSFYLATKLPCWLVSQIEDVERLLEEQLTRLQTDYIDFYLLHALEENRWRQMRDLGVVDLLKEKQAQGKIRYLGFSFHDKYEVLEEILNYRDWDFCQIQLNYIDVNDQAGLRGYALAEAKNVPLVIMEPVKGGSLAAFAEDLQGKFHAHDARASVASFALRWVGSLPGVKVILSGMSTMEQVEDNLKTFETFRPLSQAEQATIDEVVKILNSRVRNGCTGCRYCMPCPAGVNIPGCFGVWNTYHMYQNYNVVKWRWEREIGEKRQAGKCVKCGKCEKECPQHLSIREDLAKVQEDLDRKAMIL
ncbi:MAG: aldo/keto reductase [Clostridium sp.]|jgi:predicted aldo/keto reductase-like oxidoreductase|nr:aldo/keto reductase [Clostridium sp.]